MNKVIKLAVLPAALFMNSGLIHAAAPGAYVGLGGGVSAQQDQQGYSQNNDNSFSGRAFAGFNFNRYFGLEANYANLGTATFSDNDYNDLRLESSLQAFSVVGKIYLPLSNGSPFNLYAFGGAAHMNAKYNLHYASFDLGRTSGSSIVGTGGLGMSYDVNRNLVTGIELTGYGERETNLENRRIGTPAAMLATVSIAYKF